MELRLENGKYLVGKHGELLSVSGREEKLQRILMRLTARRGAFPLLPDYGSRLHQLGRAKTGQRKQLAAQYIAEALQEEDGVTLSDLALGQSGDRLTLEIWLQVDGEPASMTTVI